MTRARQSLGKQGEDLACRELRRRGYAIVARRHRTRFGGDTATAGFHKQHRLINMARSYLMGVGGTLPPSRFDVVGVTLAQGDRPVLDVVVNAFVVG